MAVTRVKICCIGTVEEAALAVDYGASAIGLVSDMPSGPGIIDEEMIKEIAATIPPGVASFLLTSRQDVSSIIEQQNRCLVNTIQVCDFLKEGTYDELRAALPGIHIVQAIHITGNEAVQEALKVAPFVDAILLDSGNQNSRVKQLGGTGRTHNWSISRKICDEVPVPVFLAGGLKPNNVNQAIHQVYPYGVDVCSGVRTDGRMDEKKLSDFFKAVKDTES